MAKILLVDDDPQVGTEVKRWLERGLHLVELATDGRLGLDMVMHYKFDLIILDWMLPLVSGIEICTSYRKQGGITPIIMLTGRSDVSDKLTGFECGADDYLSKPFDFRELNARVKALLKRPPALVENVIAVRDLVLDLAARKLTRDGVEIPISPKEFALLELFVRNPNQVLSTTAILDRVWLSESDATSDALRTQLKKLRKKIDKEGQSSIIRNLPGQGYRLDV